MEHSIRRSTKNRSPENTGRILVVDDERGVTEMLKTFLTLNGYEAFAASDGRAGLELLREHGCFDLIITDIAMPGMTGPAMLEEIVRDCPDSRVILISGYSEGAIPEITSGSWVLLPKPFSLGELLAAVRASLSAPSPGAAT